MSVVSPLPKDKAASELHVIYDVLSKKYGKMPYIFGLMAHRPGCPSEVSTVLFRVMEGGTVGSARFSHGAARIFR